MWRRERWLEMLKIPKFSPVSCTTVSHFNPLKFPRPCFVIRFTENFFCYFCVKHWLTVLLSLFLEFNFAHVSQRVCKNLFVNCVWLPVKPQCDCQYVFRLKFQFCTSVAQQIMRLLTRRKAKKLQSQRSWNDTMLSIAFGVEFNLNDF